MHLVISFNVNLVVRKKDNNLVFYTNNKIIKNKQNGNQK